MDVAVPTLPKADPYSWPYSWTEADPAEKAAHGVPMQSIDGGPQVSQPTDDADPVPAPAPVKTESSRAATVRRVAMAAAGVGLMAAAVLTARSLRGANAAAAANVIDYDD